MTLLISKYGIKSAPSTIFVTVYELPLVLGQTGDSATIKNIRQELALDQPKWKQFVLYLNDVSPISIHSKEEIEITTMDSTSKVLEENTDKLEEQTKKVEESLEKLDKEFDTTN